MIIYPAVDIRGGRAVRLQQGDFEREHVFFDSPAIAAQSWVDRGASWLHVVDLDGARDGAPANERAIAEIAKLPVKVQLGGGLRSLRDIDSILATGIDRVILGTAAANDPQLLIEACQRHPGQVVVGIDARSGQVATHGWRQSGGLETSSVVASAAAAGACAIVYTDIARDGMLSGIDSGGLARVCRQTAVPVIASGGVGNLGDVASAAAAGAAGLIIGRALYDGRIQLAEALAAGSGR